ncbi:TPA: hypothetical protein ACH3X2_007811 [Trebouxia sp. C0005]
MVDSCAGAISSDNPYEALYVPDTQEDDFEECQQETSAEHDVPKTSQLTLSSLWCKAQRLLEAASVGKGKQSLKRR